MCGVQLSVCVGSESRFLDRAVRADGNVLFTALAFVSENKKIIKLPVLRVGTCDGLL